MLLASVPADQPRREIDVILPAVESPSLRLQLRWNGLTYRETHHKQRPLAFRIMAVGWQNSGTALDSAFESFQRGVDAMLLRGTVDYLPAIGDLLTGIRRLHRAHDVMTQEQALWRQLTENLVRFDTDAPKTVPHFVIDCSTYMLNNNGDSAMFTVLLRRLQARYPGARISMITNDAEGIAALDSSVTPIVVGDRRLWSIEMILSASTASVDRTALWRAENALRLIAPRYYWGLVGATNPAAAQAGRAWQSTIQAADAVFLSGGGYFTDAFAEHTLSLLTTLEEGIAHGVATFIVGCGFEPITDPLVNAAADSILPRVDYITSRENNVSPQVLIGHGVDPTRFSVTGDDALELAFEARPAALGNAIGVNLRNAVYNPLEAAQIALIRDVLTGVSETLGAALLPLPISTREPSDSDEIRKLLPEGDGGESLNSPRKLFEQMRACRLIVTGSYHAAVFGLAMGIPAIMLTNSSHYQHKMQGLAAIFARPGVYEDAVLSLDDPALGQKLPASIQRMWAVADDARPYLLETTTQQIQAGHSAYEKIFKRIDNARAYRSSKPVRAPILTAEIRSSGALGTQ